MSQSRIQGVINSQERVVVKGSTSSLLARSVDAGRMSGGQNLGRMLLLLAPTAEQDAAAEKLIVALHDPSSPSYHKWLSPSEFGQQFGVNDYDALQVQQWLQSQGLTVHEVSQSHRFIVFSGAVSQVESAFSTQMHAYQFKDKSFISNSSDIQIPAALQSVVKGVVTLHSDPRSPSLVMGGKVHFQKKTGSFDFSDGSHNMTPADFAKIYNVQPLYDAGINGAGQTIAIVGRSNIDVQNVRQFRSILGLPANDPEVIVNGDDPGQVGGEMPEALLDVTWSGAVAPMATIKFVVSQSNFSDGVDVSAAYIVDHNLAPVMSTSFGSCESNLGPVQNAFYNALWQQAAAQGITSFVSAGDNGGAGCDQPAGGVYASGGFAVSGLASTPYNVAVGGTQFDDTANPSAYWGTTNDPVTGRNALGYIPEKVWNESSNDPNLILLYAGSGGVSSIYAKPDWQTAPGVPNDGKRDLPDFSLSAALHDGYLVCMFGSCGFGDYFYTFGGTSASSPAAAGIMALVNQKMGGQPQGMANYIFYKLASVPGVYHDIVKGDNKVPNGLGQYTVGYSATPGYDLATGLGSMDVNALVNNWHNAASSGAGSATTLALSHGQHSTVTHGSPITFEAKVNCTSTGTCTTPTGTVSLSAASSTGDSTATGSGQLSHFTPGSFVDITTSTVPGGVYHVKARYSGDGKYNPSTSNTVQVTVDPETSQTFVGAMAGGGFIPAPISVGYGLPLSLGIVVAGNSGNGYPTGHLTLQADGQPITTYAFDGGTGNLNPSTLTLNYGEKSALLTGGPASQSSTISYVVPTDKLGAGKHQLQASYPGDSSFGSSQGSYSYTVTQAQSAIQDFFPIGTLVANVPVALAGQIGFSNGGYAPYGGTITISDVTSGTPVVLGVGKLSLQYGGSYNVPVTIKTAGKHTLRVDFSGDKNVKPSSGTYYVDFPANAPSNVSLSADLPGAIARNAITFTASVTSDVRSHPAKGSVTFMDGTTALGVRALDATGTAIFVTKALAAGPHQITATYAGDGVLTSAVSGPITEVISDYVLQVFPSSITIKDGATGTATFNLTPIGGYSQTIKFSCGPLPTRITCNFNQPTVKLNGVRPSTVTLTVDTDGGNENGAQKSSPNHQRSYSVYVTATADKTPHKAVVLNVIVTK